MTAEAQLDVLRTAMLHAIKENRLDRITDYPEHERRGWLEVSDYDDTELLELICNWLHRVRG